MAKPHVWLLWMSSYCYVFIYVLIFSHFRAARNNSPSCLSLRTTDRGALNSRPQHCHIFFSLLRFDTGWKLEVLQGILISPWIPSYKPCKRITECLCPGYWESRLCALLANHPRGLLRLHVTPHLPQFPPEHFSWCLNPNFWFLLSPLNFCVFTAGEDPTWKVIFFA